MSSITIIAAWLAVAGVSATAAAPQSVGEPATIPRLAKAIAGFDANDPAYAKIQSLNDIANDLDDQPSTKRDIAAIRAAWDAAVEAGLKTKVLGTALPHPLAGRALIARASMAQAAGDNAAAMAFAQRGMAVIRPFRDFYPDYYMQGVSMIGFLQAAAGQPADGAATLAEGVSFYDKYVASIPVAKRTRLLYMVKSNAEFSYASALSKLGQNDRAVQFQRRSAESRATGFGENHPDTISAYYNHALMLLRAGRAEEAEAEARQTVERAIDHVDVGHASYARAFEALGLILARNGSRTESAEYLRRALEIKRKTVGPMSPFFHAGLLNLGDIFVQLERYEEAGTVLAEAAAGFRAAEGQASHEAARAAAYGGIAAFADGRTAVGAEQLQAVLDTVRSRDGKEREIGRIVLPDLIVAKLATGRAEEARALAASFSAEVRAFDNAPLFMIANADTLRAYADQGSRADWAADARAAARRMVEIVRDNNSLSRDGQMPQRERAALDLALRVAADSGDAALALDAMTVLAGSKIAQANRFLAQRMADTDPSLAARVRALQDRVKAFQEADAALLKALPTDTGIAVARATQKAAKEALEAARLAMARDHPRWVEARGAAPVDLVSLQAGLGVDEGVLGVIPANDGVYVLAITRGGAVIHRTAIGRTALLDLVKRIRTSLPLGKFDTAASHALHQQIFTPVTLALLKPVKALRIVPTGALSALPFAVLLERPAVIADRQAAYLIKRFALSTAPGFAALPVTGSAVSMQLSGARFLGVGAPMPFVDQGVAVASRPSASARVLTAASYFRSGFADKGALASLPILPGTARELRAVGEQFGSARATLLVGSDASEARLRSMDLTDYSVMLFATHGLVSGEMEGVTEPSLVLSPPGAADKTDGLLSASEIGMLRLNADWVILSACNTAAGDGSLAPAYSGLAQAFRYAGARSLLVSHWPVRDDAASDITIQTVTNTARGMRRDLALQKAMLRFLADRTVADGADPYIWAPYVLLD